MYIFLYNNGIFFLTCRTDQYDSYKQFKKEPCKLRTPLVPTPLLVLARYYHPMKKYMWIRTPLNSDENACDGVSTDAGTYLTYVILYA